MEKEDMNQIGGNFLYVKCPDRFQIVADPKMQFLDKDKNNHPILNNSKEQLGVPWPDNYVRELFDRACAQDMNAVEGKQIAIVCLFLTAQLLFEKAIWAILNFKSTENKGSTKIFPLYMNTQNIIFTYDEISDCTLDSLLEPSGYVDFIKNFYYLSDLKKRILQDTFSGLTFENSGINDIKTINDIKNSLLEVFYLIENDVYRQINAKTIIVKKKIPSVLIVDDEADIRKNMERFFGRKGAKVYSADCGKTAIETYDKNKIDFVLLDVMLPDMDGIEVLKQLKIIDPEIKIYFLTGIDGESFRTEAKKLGVSGHFVKPISIENIWKTVIGS